MNSAHIYQTEEEFKVWPSQMTKMSELSYHLIQLSLIKSKSNQRRESEQTVTLTDECAGHREVTLLAVVHLEFQDSRCSSLSYLIDQKRWGPPARFGPVTSCLTAAIPREKEPFQAASVLVTDWADLWAVLSHLFYFLRGKESTFGLQRGDVITAKRKQALQ